MSTAPSLWSRIVRVCRPEPGPGWWPYFGSFGDDIFDDE